MAVEFIDNINKTLKEDLEQEINEKSAINIIANQFSIYAYEKMKAKLDKVKEFNFVFNQPSFLVNTNEKESKEFYIPKTDSAEDSLYGSSYEIKLKNELTLKAVAKECGEWIKKKAKFKSNTTNSYMTPFMIVNDKVYHPLMNFTTVELGLDKGNNMYCALTKQDGETYNNFKNIFDNVWQDNKQLIDVTDAVIENITNCYKENSPESIYYLSLYNIFNKFLGEMNEDVLPKVGTNFKETVIWNKLFDFQKDAALGIINKLEAYNGCILADSVGLGKTFTALAVIKYYELRNSKVLVLCPKKLENNWLTYRENYISNILINDRFAYDLFFHTDMSRDKGMSCGKDIAQINWGGYDLVVIDESHNFRNGTQNAKTTDGIERTNRYDRLMKKVIKSGVPTKVLMLSATPVNNRFLDLKNQLKLAYEGNSEEISQKMNLKKNIDQVFREAQMAFNEWSKEEPVNRTTKSLLKRLNYDFFSILDSVTIARSRKHIETYYDINKIGKFPHRLKPISLNPDLTDVDNSITYKEMSEILNSISLCVYIPSHYILPAKIKYYEDKYNSITKNNITLTQLGREMGTRHLMAITLLKRLESSVYAFRITLDKIISKMENSIASVEKFKKSKAKFNIQEDTVDFYNEDNDFDPDDENEDFTIGGKIVIDIEDMDYDTWMRDIKEDLQKLYPLREKISKVTPNVDKKLNTLKEIIDQKINNPINDDNNKVMLFTAFSDTANYIYEELTKEFKEKYDMELGLVTGQGGKTTFKEKLSEVNTIMTLFSPISKEMSTIKPNEKRKIDILIGTDCISEGQNLQDCDYLVNYDIHWNPVRIIQRFGRIDRIGSLNNDIQLVNFWPSVSLDEYLDLKGRVESRMKIVDLTSTADDNVIAIDDEEKVDISYRKKQLENLKNEVVNMEEMSEGVSITDLGLNDFRMDLLAYIENHKNINKMPFGLNAIVKSDEFTKPGVIYVLKNINKNINIDNENQLHPYYLVYISHDGTIINNHIEPKQILDALKHSCQNQKEAIKELCDEFNKETDDGKNMKKYSDLLSKAINSIINKKEESDTIALLKGENIDLKKGVIKGLDDFELISFIIVK